MQKTHAYRVSYTVAGIPHGNSWVFAPSKVKALKQAEKDLIEDGPAYDKESLKVELDSRLEKHLGG